MAGNPESPGGLKEVRLRDLRVDSESVAILARVVSATRKEVTRRSDGGRRPVVSGLLSDGTATVRFTWWDPPSEEIERGLVVRAGPVQAKEFQGRIELSFGWKTRVEPASPSELPNLAEADLPLRPIGELKPGDEGFRVRVRVARVRPKEVTVGRERREIREGLLGDGSGSLAFTAWSDPGLKEGDSVELAGGYVSAFRGRAQLVLDERTRLEPISADGLPSTTELLSGPAGSLRDLEAGGGAEVATVEGIAVALMPPSGLVYRCPQCSRAVSKGLCRVHGAVTGVPDLRARVVLDDGTATATVNLGRDDTERLWGRTLADALDRLRSTPDPTVLEEELFAALFGRRLRASGRASVDDFGLTISPESVSIVSLDPTARATAVDDLVRGRAP